MKQGFVAALLLATACPNLSVEAQTLTTGQQVNYNMSLTGKTFTNAEAFETTVMGGGANGPGNAQVTMHLLDKKVDWDAAAPPPSGEVDSLWVDSYNGGPVVKGGTTADTSAVILNAHNNCNGFSNAIEGQASQYLPGNNGNTPLLQVDGQFLGVYACNGTIAAGVSGLALGLTYAPPTHTGSWDAITLGAPGSSGYEPAQPWDRFMVASDANGNLKWSVDGTGNEFLNGNLVTYGYVRSQATQIIDTAILGHTLNSADCGTLTRDETTGPHYVTIPSIAGTGIPVGCIARFEQAKAGGTILGSASSGMTLNVGSGVTKKASNGQWAIVEFVVDSSSTVVMRGDVD